MTSTFLRELATYVRRIGLFQPIDWLIYLSWVGLLASLSVLSATFLMVGHRRGGLFPAEAYLLPIGAGIFTLAVAIDTIGHRTVYKEALAGGETLVHHITMFAGVSSCVLLCLAYPQRAGFAVPAMVLTALSFLYSFVDEVMHWRRYLARRSDRVEMWSHAFILIGHGTMMLGWWRWYGQGYAGVPATLAALGL